MNVLMTNEAEAKLQSQVQQPVRSVTLSEMVTKAVSDYLTQLDPHSASNLFELVMDEVREPLLKTVLHKLRGNQSGAARLMGVSRGTLRKLMKRYGILD